MVYDSPVNALEAPWVLSCWSHLEDQKIWTTTAGDESLYLRQNCKEIFALLNGVGYRARNIIMAHAHRPLGVSNYVPLLILCL